MDMLMDLRLTPEIHPNFVLWSDTFVDYYHTPSFVSIGLVPVLNEKESRASFIICMKMKKN